MPREKKMWNVSTGDGEFMWAVARRRIVRALYHLLKPRLVLSKDATKSFSAMIKLRAIASFKFCCVTCESMRTVRQDKWYHIINRETNWNIVKIWWINNKNRLCAKNAKYETMPQI